MLTAAARALHREEPQPWVIDDYLALGLAGPDGLALLDRLRTEVPRHHLLAFSRWVCVRARLATLAQCRAGTRVVLTYNQPSAALASVDAQITGALARVAAQLGEPFISRFLRTEMAELLHHYGFGEITDFGPDEARAAYFGGHSDAEIAGPSG